MEHSLMLGQLVLSRVLQRYRVQAARGRRTGTLVTTSSRPKGGVWVTLEKREGSFRTQPLALEPLNR